MKILILKVFFFLLLFAGFLLFPCNTYANILFQDDFESNNLSKWEIISGNWLTNEVLGSIRAGNYIPSSSDAEIQAGDFNWTDYEFSVDVLPIYGVDKNIFFRVRDQRSYALPGHNLPVSYGLHLTASLLEFQKRTVDGWQMLRSANVGFPSNIVTKITIRVVWPEINIFINDSQTPVIHFVDSDIDFKKGRIALAIITGASPTEVWYDNVIVAELTPILTPTPTQTPLPTPVQDIPIVFLPGLGGCFNFEEMFLDISNPAGWAITTGSNIYNNLLKTFENKDYFYTYCYDWRKPVLENAQKLSNYIKNDINPPENKVALVGHSLGGLVARACVQKTENNCYADKLITVGSPHAGTVDAYPAIEGGEIWRTGPIKLGYELLVHFHQKLGETKRDTLERIAPVIKDLLPNFDYLIKDGDNLDPNDLFFQNELLPQLQDHSSLNNLTKTISGRGFESTEKIVLGKRNKLDQILGLWPDGKPINRINTEEGDTSVLTKSASFENPQIENFPYNFNHGQIISENEPLEKIIELLGLDISVVSGQPSWDNQNYLVFFVHSPVKINLLSPPANSLIENEIIIIPDPPPNDYQVELIGLGNGEYQFSVGQIFDQAVIWNDYIGTISQNETKKLFFSVDSQNPSENPLIDPNGDETKAFLKDLLEKLKEQINNLNLKHNYLKKILQNLANINSKNPEFSLVQLGLLRNTLAGYERKNLIDPQEGSEIRSTCSKIAIFLENLSFLKEKSLSRKKAAGLLKQANNLQKNAEKKLNINSAFVFQEAQEKLQKAQDKFNLKKYFQSQIYCLESISLFNESIILSK